MLLKRYPPHDKRPTQTESEGLEKNYPSKWTGKKSRGSHTYIRQNRLQNKGHKKDPESHFIILKGRIHQEYINIINVYTPNIGVPKYVRKILEDYKKDKDSNSLILEDLNTPLAKNG